MENIEKFCKAIKEEHTMSLATAAGDSVTMRTVSPVFCENNILIFTRADSKKYQQLKANPNCCISIKDYFAEATVEFLGATMKDENERYRKVYSEKFADAFVEGVQFGGRESEFILIKPNKLRGWGFEISL